MKAELIRADSSKAYKLGAFNGYNLDLWKSLQPTVAYNQHTESYWVSEITSRYLFLQADKITQ